MILGRYGSMPNIFIISIVTNTDLIVIDRPFINFSFLIISCEVVYDSVRYSSIVDLFVEVQYVEYADICIRIIRNIVL